MHRQKREPVRGEVRRRQRRNRRIWRNCVSVMACVVVFCVTYALIIPAITMEKEAFCGIEAHVHEESCYNSTAVAMVCDPAGEEGLPVLHAHDALCYDGEALLCTLPELAGHVHTDGCYETVTTEAHSHDETCIGMVRGELLCEALEDAGHAHDSTCYAAGETLICTETLREGHAHGDACYATESALLCTAAEGEGHTHSDACYQTEKALTCATAESEGHTHGEGCTDAEGNLTCAIPEAPAHTHGEGCYTESKTLICEIPEAPAHTHGEGCFGENKTLSCQIPEDPGHAHTDACYEQVLVCGQEEREGHAHTDECYEMAEGIVCGKEEAEASSVTNLVCALQQVAPHVHNENCSDENGNLICTIQNAVVHQHVEACVQIPQTEENLSCEIQVHEHTLPCFSNPQADVETAEDWTKTFAHVKLTGNWGEDILAIAKTQLGYNESTKNYIVEEDGETMKGYTRYGAWYGVPYGDWCAMYASFCYRYAAVEGVPLHCNCPAWINELAALDLFHGEADYIPGPGELIFFDWNADGSSDHVGIVVETDGETVKTIEGNSGDTVGYHTYNLTDHTIQGYGALPVQEAEEVNPYLCGFEEHAHTEQCYDAEGNLTCGLEEHTHTEDCLGKKLFYTDNFVRAFVTIKGVTDLPEDLSVQVWEITAEEDPEAFAGMQNALIDQMATESQFVSGAGFYGMELLSDGEVYELPETVEVSVEVEFMEPLFTSQEVEDAAQIQTFMLTPQEAAAPEETEPEEKPEAAARSNMGIAVMSLFSGIGSEEEPTEPAAYDAQVISGENYEESDAGLTRVSFQSNGIAAFAVARATTVQEGTFWTRVTTPAELASGGTFMIISAEGNYALTGNSNANYQAVTLQTVKGNEQYYTISGSDSTNLRWTFSGSGNSYTIRNQGTNNYLRLGNRTFISDTSGNNTVSYYTPENVWRIYSGSYYLRNVGSGSAFTRADTDTSYTWSDPQYDHYGSGTLNKDVVQLNTRDMLIFKLSEKTALDIPRDVANKLVEEDGTVVGPDRPDYDDFLPVSGAVVEGSAAVTKDDVTVSGKAWSDPATSQLESNFRPKVEDLESDAAYAASQKIDGKVMSDKSVIYRKDDYGAFSTYPANTFGVTLSALGQEYPVKFNDTVETPLDVVFVLDVSGSMTTNKTNDGSSRMTALEEAFNDAATEILEDNPENRIGVALFSTGAWEMLPLGRYTANKNSDGVMQLTNLEDVTMPYGGVREFLVGSSSLYSETEHRSYANAGWTGTPNNSQSAVGESSDIHQGVGTYTQAGIQTGYNILAANEDTTYTVKINENTEVETQVTVIRQPVIILLSDGEPTIATNNYMDPLSGPHYGSGNGDPYDTASSRNVTGAQGYYTVLSANYFKRMVGVHYNKSALFYTIGLGIKKPTDSNNDRGYDYTSNSAAAEDQGTGDAYKRAVLDPTPANVRDSGSTINSTTRAVAQQFQALMGSSSTDQAMLSQTEWPDPWTGVPHGYLPILRTNPYASNYSYADDSYFGKLSAEELTEIFTTIINKSQSETPYGFVLYKNTHVEIEDTIGEGMEVKGNPVLRYNGVNYYIDETDEKAVTVNGNVTTYTYKGKYGDPYIDGREADLSAITVTITKNSDGTQTVRMDVPDTVLPTYTPELIGQQFYYEALPVRLIYQVGLTKESEQKVLALAESGGKLTFYTNAYQEISTSAGDRIVPEAMTHLLPSTVNPFYIGDNSTYEPHHDLKKSNPTGTADFSTDCHWDDPIAGDGTYSVLHSLGNNGKLEFKAEAPKNQIPVEKKWANVTDPSDLEATVTLYKVEVTTGESGAETKTATVEATGILNQENGFQHTFENLKAPESNWYYAIAETPVDGFTASYEGGELVNLTVNGQVIKAVKVTFDATSATPTVAIPIVITNAPPAVLPETGGPGTILYTTGGLLLMAASVLLLHNQSKKRRKGDHPSF